jgi:hypothetical protein
VHVDRNDIADRAEALESFVTGTAVQQEFRRSLIKNGKKFVAVVAQDHILFIPGHYTVAPVEQLRNLDQRQTISATSIQKCLDDLLGQAVRPGEPLYDQIDAYFVDSCGLSGDIPSTHRQPRTYWLCRV